MKTITLLAMCLLALASCGTKDATPQSVPPIETVRVPVSPNVSAVESAARQLREDVQGVENSIRRVDASVGAAQNEMSDLQRELEAAIAEAMEPAREALRRAQASAARLAERQEETRTILSEADTALKSAQETVHHLESRTSELRAVVAVQNDRITQLAADSKAARVIRDSALAERDKVINETIPTLKAEAIKAAESALFWKKYFLILAGAFLLSIAGLIAAAKFNII